MTYTLHTLLIPVFVLFLSTSILRLHSYGKDRGPVETCNRDTYAEVSDPTGARPFRPDFNHVQVVHDIRRRILQ